MTIAPLAPASRCNPALWSPGPGYAELLIPTAWVRPLGADECEVVIVGDADALGDEPVLLSGVLSATLVSLADYWLDSPAELRLLVHRGLLQSHAISAEHPALAVLARALRGDETVALPSPARLPALR
ncbi:hypothetical protein CFP71_09960 [Amycolatopsis thailandensis]|uniref:Uncharacterized protein n=1 Tax=Amycolatopsis thailandensis TaxID=589330 RepID=A0A229SE63_9PSEU|nr:hypothetical protein [Amycolatopsis thailandensis]OXM57051.1 hypothetical protein CFP71_09960 [Amycolatopsis thailandensis]